MEAAASGIEEVIKNRRTKLVVRKLGKKQEEQQSNEYLNFKNNHCQ